MKFIVALLIISVFQASATSRAQNVTINVRSASLEDVFNNIHKQTDYNFIYNSAMLENLAPVTVSANNKPLKEVLDNVLAGKKLSYTIEDKTIILSRSPEVKPVLALAVTGTVLDEKGATLPGVTVKVKGGSQVTTTDNNGVFKLNLPTGNEVIVLSFIGYKTQEVSVNGQATLTVRMEIGVSGLDEIVVVGYGTVKKKDLTGAVSSVKADDIALSPVSNPMEALQGRVAGLDIQRVSGKAGAAPTVLLRGNRSIPVYSNGAYIGGAQQDVLYVIDGIIGSITSLNPDDIESIDVLKDAASTAIYGAAGGNGVIIVTTKKAKAGKVQVDFDSYYGVNGFASYPKPLLGDAWIQYLRDRYYAGQNPNKYPATLIDAGLSTQAVAAIDAGQWIDWVDVTLKRGSQQNHHISVRGGTENTQAYMSLGYIKEKGIYQGDLSSFYNIRGGVDIKISKLFKAGLQATVNVSNNDQTNSRVNKAYGTLPLGTVYNADGSINSFPLSGNSSVNLIANYTPGALVNNTKALYAAINPYLELRPITGLSIRSQLGLTLSSQRQGQFANASSYNILSESGVNGQRQASYSNNLGYSYLWENIATYTREIHDHSFTVTGITSYSDIRTEQSLISGQGLDFDQYLFYNTGALALINARTTGYSQINKLSFAGRINYSYKGKYLLQATTRWDGASQLKQKWANFPSISAAWRISEEDFMKSTRDYVTNLKLRVGYGIAGTANIPPYVSTTSVVSSAASSNMSLGGTAALPTYIIGGRLGADILTWERAHTTNVGLDFTLFKDRLDITAEWFHTKTTGAIYPVNQPSSGGGADAKTLYTKASNVGTTSNNGVELTINSHNISNKDFKWNTAFTFTHVSERIDGLDLGNSVNATQLISNNLFIGSQLPQSVLFGYKKIGIWQLDEATEAAKYSAKPGDIKLQTVPRFDAAGNSDNGVHAYSAADRMVVGHNTPTFSMGLQNTFSYKNFDLTVFAILRYGQTINAQLLGYYNNIDQPAFYNYWTPTNPTNDFPQPFFGTAPSAINNTPAYVASLSLVDGSYIKLKNVTLGYSLPRKWIGKIGMSKLRFYGTAYNLLTYTKSHLLNKIDPETSGSDSFPLYKQIVFGLNASF